MTSELPDPDWYLDNVLYFADPGRGGRLSLGPVELWRAWWQQQASMLLDAHPVLARVALRQGFVVHPEQIERAGMSRGDTRGRIRRGHWSTPAYGVTALLAPEACADLDHWGRQRRVHALQAAAAALRHPGQAVSDGSAAVLHGLPTLETPSTARLTAPLGATRHHGRVAPIAPGEITAWFGVTLTGVARTVVDVARQDRRGGIIAADAALHARLVTVAELNAAVDSARGKPGVRQAREIVAFASPEPESPLESIVRLALNDDGFPRPELQYPMLVPGRSEPYRLDIYWPEYRVALEADGRGKYRDVVTDDAPDPLWREKKREQALRRLDCTVERVLWWEVMSDWPRRSAELRRTLGI